MFTMYDLDMNKIEYPEGFIPLDIYISSIEKERSSSKIEGSNATIENGFSYGSREIEIEFLLKSHDTHSYRLLRDEVYGMFGKFDSFYLVEDMQKGKRYSVSVDDVFIPERLPTNQRYAKCRIPCVKTGLPFAESILTTITINQGMFAEDESWSFGMGLEAFENHLEPGYVSFAKKNVPFKVYNPGIEIHPFEHDFSLLVSNVNGSKEMFQITNHTNGSRARYNKPLSPLDTLVYDGPSVTKNDLSALRDTRRDFVYLSPGWNTLQVYHCDSAIVGFDFRIYYN